MTIAKGEPLLAADMLNLAFFPKNTIIMFNGASWEDNVTLKGWYQCKGGTVNGVAIPDLRDKFIMGYSGSREGGANSIALTADNMPTHNHTFTGNNVNGKLGAVYTENNNSSYISAPFSGAWNGSSAFPSGSLHRLYTVTLNYTPSGSVSKSGSGASFDNRPAFYALIYIIKVTDAGLVK
jgi:microcystin-dependent protein